MSKKNRNTPYFQTHQILSSWNQFTARPEVFRALPSLLENLHLPQQVSQLTTFQSILYKYLAIGIFPDPSLNRLLQQYIEFIGTIPPCSRKQNGNLKVCLQKAIESDTQSEQSTIHHNNNNSSSRQQLVSGMFGTIMVLEMLVHNIDNHNLSKLTGWSVDKRKLLLLKMLPLIHTCRETEFIERIINCLITLVSGVSYTNDELLLLIEEMSTQKASKVKTLEGPLISSNSYLLLSILHQYVDASGIHHKPKHVFKRLAQAHTLVNSSVASIISKISSQSSGSSQQKGLRDFVQTLLKDCYALNSFLQFPMSLRITKQLTVQMVSHYMYEEDPKSRLQFMPLLSSIMAKLLSFMNAVSQIQIQQEEQEAALQQETNQNSEIVNTTTTTTTTTTTAYHERREQQDVSMMSCALCKQKIKISKSGKQFPITYVLKQKELETQINLCGACIIQPSNVENSINLLPLILIPSSSASPNFELHQVRNSKYLYPLELIPELTTNSCLLQRLLDKFKLIQDINSNQSKSSRKECFLSAKNNNKTCYADRICLLYLNYMCESIGLKSQLRVLFSYWIIETNAPQYTRRVRAVKEIALSLKAVFTMDKKEELTEYQKKIIKVIQTRLLDQHEAVRLESVRVLIDLIETTRGLQDGSVNVKLLKPMIDKLSDDCLSIRKHILDYLEKNSVACLRKDENCEEQRTEAIQEEEQKEMELVLKQIVFRVVQRLEDEFNSIRIIALSALKSLLFGISVKGKTKKIHNLQDGRKFKRVINLIEDCCGDSKVLAQAIIQVCKLISEGHTKALILQIVNSIQTDKKSIAPFFEFLQKLAQDNQQLFTSFIDIFVASAVKAFQSNKRDLGSGYAQVLSKLKYQNFEFSTKKQRQNAQALLVHLEKFIHTPSNDSYASNCLRLYVRFKLFFNQTVDVMELLTKCQRYLEYTASRCVFNPNQDVLEQTQTNISSTGCVLQSLTMCTIICIEKQSLDPNGQEVMRIYDRVAVFLKSANTLIQNRSLECLSCFWSYNQNIFYHSWAALDTYLPALLNYAGSTRDGLAILIYQCLLARIDQCISKSQGSQSTLILIKNLFSKTFYFVYNKKSSQLRELALLLLIKLNQTGMINVFDYIKYIFAYACDPEQTLRRAAISALLNVEDRVLYHNFCETLNFCAKYILENYGEITAAHAETGSFFEPLVSRYHNQGQQQSKKNFIKHEKYRCTFLIKIGQTLTNCSPHDTDLLTFCCCIINESRFLSQTELEQLRSAMAGVIDLRYYETMLLMKKFMNQKVNTQAFQNRELTVKGKSTCLLRALLCYENLLDDHRAADYQKDRENSYENFQTISERRKCNPKIAKAKIGLQLVQVRRIDWHQQIPRSVQQICQKIRHLYDKDEQTQQNSKSTRSAAISNKKRGRKVYGKSAPKKKSCRSEDLEINLSAKRGKRGSIIVDVEIQCKMKLRDRSNKKYLFY